MDLALWLTELGLGQYAAAFAENEIDFDVLGQLTDADLKELGVSSLGNRKRLLAAIAARTPVSAVSEPAAEISKGERRQVTILFADLCGFTALSQSLDPEEVRELVAQYTALIDGIVVSYGGTVDKHIGDAVMALFGAPKAHDDDPLRAARAALEIHEALAELTDSRKRPLQSHVGIASEPRNKMTRAVATEKLWSLFRCPLRAWGRSRKANDQPRPLAARKSEAPSPDQPSQPS